MLNSELVEKYKKLSTEVNKIGEFLDIKNKQKLLIELESKLSDNNLWSSSSQQERINIVKTLQQIKNDIEIFTKINSLVAEIDTILELSKQSPEDSYLNSEFHLRVNELEKILKDIKLNIFLNSPHDESNAILTLHAGAGGTEACDWVEMLFRMYSRWAVKKKFEVEIVDMSKGEEAGIRSVTFIVKGKYAYGLLKGEEGVHRLVRISPFDANKRRHTSFASCDVSPEVEEKEIEIDEKDLKIETFRASGHGGQHLQKTESAVRITHIPTGITVQCQTERSQLKNKITALKILKSKLYKLKQQQQNLEKKKERIQKGEIGWGRQTRSYIFMPYQLVKDHITGVEVTNVEAVMNGEIDVFIETYLEIMKKIENK
ncbi:MAG: peptide chain release factor 2 [Endomicrobia bacterium]|nr:peptide chain release factor 2 [Endomicrobiia bacterium]